MPTKIARRAGHLNIFQMLGVCPGGMLAAGIDSHIKRDVTIIINFENIADGNALFGKVKKKKSILGTFLTQPSA